MLRASSSGMSAQTFPQHSHHILQQLNLQRHYGVFCDVILQVDKYDFKAHKCVLAAGCPKLQTMLYNMRQECGNVLALKDLPVMGFRFILEYLYTGTLELKHLNIHDILAAAQYLDIREVEKACLDYQYYKGVSSYGSSATSLPHEDVGYRGANMAGTVASGLHAPSISPTHDARCQGPMMQQPPPSIYSAASNMNADTSYIEDYLKLIEPPPGGTVNPSMTGFVSGYSNSRETTYRQLQYSERDSCAHGPDKAPSVDQPGTSQMSESLRKPSTPPPKPAMKDQATLTDSTHVPPSGEEKNKSADELLVEKPTEERKQVKEEVVSENNSPPITEVAMETANRQKRKKKVPIKLNSLEMELEEDHEEMNNFLEDDDETDDYFEEEEELPPKRKRGRPRRNEVRTKRGRSRNKTKLLY